MANLPLNHDFTGKVVVVTGKGIVLTGYISAGKVNVGDTVYVNDADNVRIAQTTVVAIEMFKKSINEAKKGDNAGILVDLDVDTYRSKIVAGNILSAKGGSLGTRPSTSRPSTVTRPTTTKPLAIAAQSKDMSGSIGLFKLDVTVEGGKAPYTCQWQKLTTITNGTRKSQIYMNLTDAEGTIKGATSANLTVSITTLGTYKYKCVVTDADGNSVITDAITITVNSESTGGRVSIPSTGKNG